MKTAIPRKWRPWFNSRLGVGFELGWQVQWWGGLRPYLFTVAYMRPTGPTGATGHSLPLRVALRYPVRAYRFLLSPVNALSEDPVLNLAIERAWGMGELP